MNRKKFLLFALGPLGSAIIGLVTLPIIAWYVDSENIGRLTLFQTVLNLSIVFFNLGLDQAYIRNYHQSTFEQNINNFKLIFIPGFLLFLITIFVFYISNSFHLISIYLFEINSNYISLLVLVSIFFAFLSRIFSIVVRMEERALSFSFGQILQKIVFLIIVLIIGFIFLKNIGFEKLIFAYTFSILITFIFWVLITRKNILYKCNNRISYKDLKDLVVFGLPLMIAGFIAWLLYAIDRFFLKQFSSYHELGLYAMATSIASVAAILSTIFNLIWAPTVYKWINDESKIDKIFSIIQIVFSLVYLILCLSGLFSWLIDFILPYKYSSIQYIIPICVLTPLLYTLSETTVIGISISKKTVFIMLVSIIAVIFSIIANYLMIPLYGAKGAAIATAFSFLILFVGRTELSCILWKKIPRTRLYIYTIILFIFSTCFALYGEEYLILRYVWLLLFLIGCFSFRKHYYHCFLLFIKKGENYDH